MATAVISTNKEFENMKNLKNIDTVLQHDSFHTFDVVVNSNKYGNTVLKYNLNRSYLVFDINFELIEEVSLPKVVLEASETDRFRT